MQIEKIVLFLIERQGLLAERLQRLRKQRELSTQVYYEADDSGDERPSYSPAIVPYHLMDEYR